MGSRTIECMWHHAQIADRLELSILMPCLNEAATVGACVDQAISAIAELGVDAEVIVADNGSTDGSAEIASARGARVIAVTERGYGAALLAGITAARGVYVVMADADESYDLREAGRFLDKLRTGYDLVMGNRFLGQIKPGAMPPLHRYLGNPILSALGRLFFGSPIGDFHAGMRGFRRDAILRLDLRTTGMEFASEMVVRSTLEGLRIGEVPTTLSPDRRGREPHLRTWRDAHARWARGIGLGAVDVAVDELRRPRSVVRNAPDRRRLLDRDRPRSTDDLVELLLQHLGLTEARGGAGGSDPGVRLARPAKRRYGAVLATVAVDAKHVAHAFELRQHPRELLHAPDLERRVDRRGFVGVRLSGQREQVHLVLADHGGDVAQESVAVPAFDADRDRVGPRH